MAQQFYIKGTNEAVIVDDKPFAGGGEGGLFNIQSPSRYVTYVAKIFHTHKRKDQQREDKINYMIENRPQFEYNPAHQPIVWVEKALYDEKGQFVGFIMPKATGEKLEVLCSPRLPKRLGREWQRLAFGHEDSMRLRMKVCYNIAAAIHQIHATGKYVLVDLKPDNILIHSNGLVSIVDMDSIEVIEDGETKFPATVVTPEYTPPEYYEGVRPGDQVIEKTWDEFSIAVIFYRLLLGIHPFAASAVPPYDNLVSLGDKIHHGLYVHQPNEQLFSIIPPPHRKFEELDEEVQQLFDRTFVEGHKDPKKRISAELWGTTFINSPLLLIDRPLPSKVLDLHNPMKQNWYEVAVGKAIQELKLAAPTPKTGTPLLAQKHSNEFWKQTMGQYKKAGNVLLNLAKFGGIVLAVIIGFVFFIGIFANGFDSATAFEVLGELLMLIPRTIWWFISNPIFLILVIAPLLFTAGRKGLGFVRKKVGKVFDKVQENMALTKGQRRRHLEDKQYALFTKRVKMKKRLQEIQTELNILEQVKSKKEENFQRTYGKTVNETNQQIQTELSKEAYQIQMRDQKARELMRQEAKEIRELRSEFLETLETASPYMDIPGKTPEQKINNLQYWKEQQLGTKEEIEQMAQQIEIQLEAMREQLKEKIAEIQARYDQAHKDLVDESNEYKIKIEDIVESASDKIRIESKLDSQLLDKSYRKLLKTRNELMLELYDEEDKLDGLNQEIREIRDELSQLR
jgi:serine/threonine protein kinase